MTNNDENIKPKLPGSFQIEEIGCGAFEQIKRLTQLADKMRSDPAPYKEYYSSEQAQKDGESYSQWLQTYKAQPAPIIGNPKYLLLQDFLNKKVVYFSVEHDLKELEKNYTPAKAQEFKDLNFAYLLAKARYEQHSLFNLTKNGSLTHEYFDSTSLEQVFQKVEPTPEKLSEALLRAEYAKDQMKKCGKIGFIKRTSSRAEKGYKNPTPTAPIDMNNRLEQMFASNGTNTSMCVQCLHPEYDGVCECNTKSNQTSFE